MKTIISVPASCPLPPGPPGAYNKMAKLPAEVRARGVITSSAGNHAQGVALAAARMVGGSWGEGARGGWTGRASGVCRGGAGGGNGSWGNEVGGWGCVWFCVRVWGGREEPRSSNRGNDRLAGPCGPAQHLPTSTRPQHLLGCTAITCMPGSTGDPDHLPDPCTSS